MPFGPEIINADNEFPFLGSEIPASELYYYSERSSIYKGDDTAAVRILDPFFDLYPVFAG
jgi:hypothetical protein